ncbi:MAG TPA: hypothetical protein PK514_06580 [Spirochaetota bacterium]|nr:hypothetical protein [Spirochaetota bacterium]
MKRRIAAYLLAFITLLLLPVLVTVSLGFAMALNENFHISVVKNLNIVETIIKFKNYQMENEIRHEIEKKTGIGQFKPEYDRIKAEYEKNLQTFNALNKTREYDSLEKEIDELDDTDWEDAPDTFRNKEEWKAYKKKKTAELEAKQDSIETYRDTSSELLGVAESGMKKSRDAFEDADDLMKDKEEEARDILEDRSSDFMNEIVSDMSKVGHDLSTAVNELFIEVEIRKIIRTYLAFFTDYFQQKKTGGIYESNLNIESGEIGSTKKVVLPPFELSFNVKTDENGIIKEKNIFSGLCVEMINATPGLKSPWVLTKIFSMADSWLAEKAAGSILKGLPVRYSDGVLKSQGPVILSGERAQMAEYLMIAMTAGRFFIFIGPVIAVMLVLMVFAAAPDRRSKWKIAGLSIEIPSALMSALGIAGIIVSAFPGYFFSIPVDDPAVRGFFEQGIFSTGLHFFIPVTLLFFILSVTGGFMRKRGNKI